MKKQRYFLLAVISLLSLTGCSHPVHITKTQATVTYSNRLLGKVGLFLPEDVANYSLNVPASGNACSANSFPIQIGSGLTDALQTGIQTACQEMTIFKTIPTQSMMAAQGVKFIIMPRVNNADGDIAFSAGFLSTGIKATFQASMTLNLMDMNGTTFHSFSSNGSGFSTGSGTCGEGANVMAKAVASALQQVTDNIAQTLNSSVQVRDALR